MTTKTPHPQGLPAELRMCRNQLSRDIAVSIANNTNLMIRVACDPHADTGVRDQTRAFRGRKEFGTMNLSASYVSRPGVCEIAIFFFNMRHFMSICLDSVSCSNATKAR